MTRVWLLLIGVAATVGFAAIVLVALPRVVLIDIPVPAELSPYTPEEARGRQVYIANGCLYCHSQQIRDVTFTTDVMRGWGDRPTVPADYVYDSPALLGTMRTGPDLTNVGARLPDANWHLIHLYDPRALVSWSIMPAYPYLFDEKVPSEVEPADHVIQIPAARAPEGRVVVAKPDALALVAYLLSLKRLYPLPNASGGMAPTAPAGGEPGRADASPVPGIGDTPATTTPPTTGAPPAPGADTAAGAAP